MHLSTEHKGDPSVASLLLAYGADVNATTRNQGWTSLHIAAIHGDTALARELLRNGADLSIKDKWGDTPLRLAMQFRTREVELLLLQSDADP